MDVNDNILPDGNPGKDKEPMIPLSAVMDIIANLKQTFITTDEARAIAKEELPYEFRNLNSFPNTGATKEAGRVLKLGIGAPGIPATANWEPDAGISATGDKVLYKGIFLREYDENGELVAPGAEINPGDYFTQAQYEAALDTAGHTLQYTNDWARIATGIATA